MFKHRNNEPQAAEHDPINDVIVGDGFPNLGPGISSLDPLSISDENILEAEYHTPEAKKPPLTKSKIALILAIGLFAAGGVASIVLQPDQAPPVLPPQAVTPQTESNPAPAAETSLPAGLAPAGAPTPSAPATASDSPSTSSGLPAALPAATPASIAPSAPVSPPVETQQPALTPSATPTPAEPPKGANPVTAQIAEVQANTAAQPKPATPQPAIAQPTPKAEPAAAKPAAPAVKAAPQIASAQKPAAAQAADGRTVVKKITPLPKPAAKDSDSASSDDSHEGIKRLITTSADALNLQSIQDGAITLDSRRGNGPQRLQAGDRLPSGEEILKIDAQSMTIVTDRSVIRLK